ncbi:2-oxoglutarate and iron-dependent oxygenase domain-containing protein [Pseudomonas sp. R2-60-08W]|uniref:2-oxoglutarate and iron-dependent oxygenase domain-containing protein n=1 Tax=Pseudomonas sp. R2-60-08W TaxID=1173280 RepID=UPI000F6C32B8|nr:2-oxoglutarate and iron-dependent oxygenase domain-containing protein [Pseudomonas sp. R2-60-08W]AZF26828.1 Oxidoreductase [Pseudomonas sp. R2-60-08W]
MEALNRISLEMLESIDTPREVRRLRETCIKDGFFYLTDHGISPSFIDQAFTAARQFFELPLEIKNQFSQDHQKVSPKTCRGYVHTFGETLHAPTGPDCKQHFDMGREAALCEKPFTGPNLLPDEQTAPAFAKAMLALQDQVMHRVVPGLLHGLALALGLNKLFFEPFFSDPVLIQRALYYPPQRSGAGKHTDNGIFTLLFQEAGDACALRAFSRGRWIDVPPRGHEVVINLGDMLMKWSNGLFTSTPHQVIHRADNARVSLPFFVYPNVDARFNPLGSDQVLSCQQVMLENFNSIWVTGQGAGRARELA